MKENQEKTIRARQHIVDNLIKQGYTEKHAKEVAKRDIPDTRERAKEQHSRTRRTSG